MNKYLEKIAGANVNTVSAMTLGKSVANKAKKLMAKKQDAKMVYDAAKRDYKISDAVNNGEIPMKHADRTLEVFRKVMGKRDMNKFNHRLQKHRNLR